MVMGHVHWIHTAGDWHGNAIKAIPIMAAWHYNWTAAHAVYGEQVYFATQDVDGRPVRPIPRLLVLAPTVPFDMGGLPGMASEYLRRWQLRVLAFARLALMSGRVPVWPTMDCAAGFIGNGFQIKWPAAPFEVAFGWLPYYDHQTKHVSGIGKPWMNLL